MTPTGKSQAKAKKIKGMTRPVGEQHIEPGLYAEIVKAIRQMQPAYCVRA